ncbi:curli production assembly protein CsgG, partial [Pseudomonas aeruginosa]
MSHSAKKALLPLLAVATLAGLAGCATDTSTALPVQQVASVNRPYSHARPPIPLGKYDNRSRHMPELYSDCDTRIAGTAATTASR